MDEEERTEGRSVPLPILSPRQQNLIRFALWRFARDARAQAEWAAQERSITSDRVRSFLRDAEDSEHLLGVLRAEWSEE